MRIVDLSRELYHRTPAHPAHPPVVMTVWNDHSEIKEAGGVKFSSKAMSIALSDHAGTHIDAPCHFDSRPEAKSIDEMPLENFYTGGLCLDLSHAPLRHEITVDEMETALAASGGTIEKGDTVLLHMGVNARLWGSPGYLHDFPGLHVESVHWHPAVRRRGDQPGAGGGCELQGASGLRRTGHHAYRVPLESGGAGRAGTFQIHRLSAEAERRHREPDPRRRGLRGLSGWPISTPACRPGDVPRTTTG